ncbi:MAG: Mu-like prophage major head subunit gpT family protein [Planctomycetota bacterium]
MGASGLGSRAIIGKFYAALEAATGQSWVGRIAMMMNSDQESETYKWLGMVPALREWIGGRQAKGFRENGLTITNKTWEATLEILVDWIRRDKTGQIAVRISELAKRAIEHDAKLLSTLIANGTGATSGLCYDGQYFFDTDHSEGDSGTQLNLLAAAQVPALDVTTATAPTSAEATKAILGVVAYMLTYKDDQGEPMNDNAREFLVMTAPVLWAQLAQGIIQPVVTSGETNAIVALKADGFNISIAANSRLTYTTQFVTFRTDAPAKPFIVQEEEPMSVSALAEGSEEEFKNNRHLYGIKRISNVGYGYWQYAAHATLS